ncbi:MAG TPA: flavodoxin family protein [Candidatus Woesearchaeota archaeon]|nr:flavodoxin family protein [Candidatus Woesearchaeota archaeon]
MKVLAICGSPRKGNTEFMLNKVLESAENVEKELILLRNLDIKPCTGCDICYNEGKPCPIEDDMKQLYEKLLKADIIVFGSPNYFKNVSGLMKNFIDRTNAIVEPPRLKDKKAAIVCVGGQDLNNTQFCENVLREFIDDHKMVLIGSVIAKAEGPKEIKESTAIINELEKLGKKLVK